MSKRFRRKNFSLFFVLLISFSAANISAQQNSSDNKAKISPCDQSGKGGGISSGNIGYPYGLAINPQFDRSANAESPKTFPLGTKPLRFRSKPIPKYTDEARQNCIEGTIMLRITFLANGDIGKIKVLKGLDYGLSNKAVEAAKLIKFEPEVKGNKAVTVSKKVTYNFTIY